MIWLPVIVFIVCLVAWLVFIPKVDLKDKSSNKKLAFYVILTLGIIQISIIIHRLLD